MAAAIDCVLGSGPAAVACASALLDAGHSVVMIAPDKRLPADRQKLADDFRVSPDTAGFVEQMRRLREKVPSALRAKKLPFASPYIYEGVDQVLPLDRREVVVERSLAAGGLSAVWGATVIPFRADSFRDWPVNLREMEPFYRRVAKLMPVPCPHDDLESIYENFGEAPPQPLSEQGVEVMSRLVNSRARLAEAGIRFGRGRSAIGKTCVGCGLCMYGCPYKAIFNADYVVDALKQRAGFTYKSGFVAEGYEENPTGIVVRVRHVETGAVETIGCERLFVGAGASTSLRLVVGAMGWFDRPFYLQDTQQFSIPVFLANRCRAGAVPQSPALSQIFVEMDAGGENIHMQLYGYNPFMADILRARWGGLAHPRLLQPLFDRMMVVMGYLPGVLSGKISIALQSGEKGGLTRVVCTGIANARAVPAIREVGRRLWEQKHAFGFLPVLPLTEIPPIGTSVHLAGCLPMKAAPEAGETDALGRPFGAKNVHVVDSACFSALPSEHLTYTIMANAARIATQASEGREA
ncbi:MAG: GMC oxidoreductase [Alphaproteobacteria bacterium]|nr:GMC oxidoreductase [Alphaproteobacteria bacterium]